MTDNRLHVHFMGICGSGCASIAMVAHDLGFQVSGCDAETSSYYAEELKKRGIPIETGHDPKHLQGDVDVVAVSPALFDIAPDNAELLEAKARGILMTWQEFMGKYLQEGKRLTAIAGTHGKTTTTFLTSEILIDAGLSPSCVGGSVYRAWGSGGRAGTSDLFVCEADEFNRNFHNYRPEIALLTNVEMDHPECYSSFEEVLESFRVFLTEGGKLKTIILNGDSEGAVEVLRRSMSAPALSGASVIFFTRNADADYSFCTLPYRTAVWKPGKKEPGNTVFTVTMDGKCESYSMLLSGEYDIQNAVSAALIAGVHGVSPDSVRRTLGSFQGVGRRFDCIGEALGVPVYDDYAHHPTEIRSVLSMCREYYPKKRILAVFEPHQISRLRLMFSDYVDALTIADEVIIAKTHIGREIHKNAVPISKEEWEAASPKIWQEDDADQIAEEVLRRLREREYGLVIVIGAAGSYKISRKICDRGSL